MLTDQELLQVVSDALAVPRVDWHAYGCFNEVQSLLRVSCLLGDRYECQFNEIIHAEVPHCHDANMASVILRGGYAWRLRQDGATQFLPLFAATGSIIRMGPRDTHSIPRLSKRSLSFCVFDRQTDWHLHYTPMARFGRNRILSDGLLLLGKWRESMAKRLTASSTKGGAR